MRAAGALPGLARRRWPRRCRGRRILQVPADIWLGQHDGLGAARRARASRLRWAVVLLAGCQAGARARRPARWWCRVAEAPGASTAGAERCAVGATPTSRGCGCARRWPTRRRSWMMAVSGFLDHRPRLRRHLAHVPHRRRPRRLRPCPRSPSSTAPAARASRSPTCSSAASSGSASMIRHRPARRRCSSGRCRCWSRSAPTSSRCAGFGRITQAVLVLGWALLATSTGRRRRCWSRVLMVVAGSVIFFGALRRLRLHPVLDHRRHRGRQRLHLRRQHHHPVPAHHLPERGRSRR